MSPFTLDDVAGLAGPPWLGLQRTQAMERFLAGPMPTSADEIWRYSRIDELDLAARSRASASPGSFDSDDFLAAVGATAFVVETVDGRVASSAGGAEGVRVGPPVESSGLGRLTDTAAPWDAFVTLNRALAPDPLIVTVDAGVVVPRPIVVEHVTTSGVAFPRTLVVLGEGSRATVVERRRSGPGSGLCIPVIELDVGDNARLDHLVVQELDGATWEIAYHASRLGRDSSLRSFTIAFGGDYARVRTDSRLEGAGGTSELLALFFGDGHQMHDFRTLQDHEGPKSTSDLVFKGAVTGEARSAYSGLIRVRPGAAGTKAFQTNRNLVLSDTGLASYSVPNLDIEDNDVTCSHASATGPIDEDQLFYLESRGIPSAAAERLIVVGFFDDLLSQLAVPGLRAHLLAEVAAKL